MPRKRRKTIDTATVRETRDQLAALLEAVRSGQVKAPYAAVVAHLEGAVDALSALLDVLAEK